MDSIGKWSFNYNAADSGLLAIQVVSVLSSLSLLSAEPAGESALGLRSALRECQRVCSQNLTEATLSALIATSPLMSMPSCLAKEFVTHLLDFVVKLVNSLVRLLSGLLELSRSVLAVLLELCIHLGSLSFRVAAKLVRLALDLSAGGLGILLQLLCGSWDVVADLARDLGGIGWREIMSA